MTKPLALSGDYADFRIVKTRSCIQLVVEIPIEEGERAVQLFGIPQPGSPVKVALARLAETRTIEHNKPEKERRRWNDLPPAQQAAIRCGEPAFKKFLADEKGYIGETDIVESVRYHCHVLSRADIKPGTDAAACWRELDAEFQAWLLVPA
jgi:hypothetical protein